jgi:Na+/H+-dicarboxylate symporter
MTLEEKTIVRSRRTPLIWIPLIFLTVVLGLASRRYGHALPSVVATYAGDTLWALVAFLVVGLVLPRASTLQVATLALSFSALIEISQLYHASWIDAIRQTTPGSLVLGHGFLWSDLACYVLGVTLGVIVEAMLPGGINPGGALPRTGRNDPATSDAGSSKPNG